MVIVGRRLRRRSERRARRARRPRWVKAMVMGVLLMGVGMFALLQRFWPAMPDMDQLWPVFPILGGFGLLLGVLANGFRSSGPVFPGVAGIGVGTFFLLITLGPLEFSQLDRLWPVFPLIGGIAFFWTWAASFGRRMGLLVPAILFSTVGVVGLLFTLTPLSVALGALGWPVLLLIAGMGIVLVAGAAQAARWLKASALKSG